MSNREWLKDLATTKKQAWLTATLPTHLDGSRRLETARTIYVFEDGVCTEVARREAPEETESSMVGMRIVGWLLDVEGERRMVRRWLPGARAILWRVSENGDSKIALTSRSFGFVSCKTHDDEWEIVTTEYVPRERPSLPARPTATGSFTRFDSPQPARV